MEVNILNFDLNRHNRQKVSRALVDTCIEQAQAALDAFISNAIADTHPHTFTPYDLRNIAHSLAQAKKLHLEVDLWRVRDDLNGMAHMILDNGYDGALAQSLSRVARAYTLWYENRQPSE